MTGTDSIKTWAKLSCQACISDFPFLGSQNEEFVATLSLPVSNTLAVGSGASFTVQQLDVSAMAAMGVLEQLVPWTKHKLLVPYNLSHGTQRAGQEHQLLCEWMKWRLEKLGVCL